VNNDKNLQQLLNTCQQIPTEMDYVRIDALVRDFPAGGNASSSITYPKLLTIAALLATAALALLLMDGADNNPPKLAAIAPTYTTESEVVAEKTEGLDSVTGEEPTAVTPASPAPKTLPPPGAGAERQAGDIAPAAAPTKTPPAPQNVIVAPPVSQPAPAYMPPFGETTITGRYEILNDRLRLETVERVNGRKITWMLPTQMSGEEQLLLFPRSATTGYLERETGRLILMSDGGSQKRGNFSFQPHIETRKSYEKAGLGTGEVPAERVKLHGMQQGVSLAKEVYSERPAEILWLRYFSLDINREYLDVLRGMGYDEEDFSRRFHHEHGHGEDGGLWLLANNGLTAGELTSLDRTLQLLYGKVGEAFSLTELTELYQHRKLLNTLVKEGYQSLGANQLRSLMASDVSPAYLSEMNQVIDRRLTPPELRALREANLFATGIRRLQRDGYTDLPVADYIQLHTKPETAKEELEEAQLLTISEDFGKKRKGWRASHHALAPFSKLVVEDDIRLVIIPGDANEADVVTIGMKGVSVDLDVSKNGTLKIRKKLKIGWQTEGVVVAEIRLTASQLERIEVKAPARVFMIGDRSAYEIRGRVGSAELE